MRLPGVHAACLARHGVCSERRRLLRYWQLRASCRLCERRSLAGARLLVRRGLTWPLRGGQGRRWGRLGVGGLGLLGLLPALCIAQIPFRNRKRVHQQVRREPPRFRVGSRDQVFGSK